jgi:hypothetical protein
MTYYIGNENTSQSLLGPDEVRYFYGLSRDAAGTLKFTRIDQLLGLDTLTVNNLGPASENFENFEYGVDFFDGRDATDHSRPYENLNFDQYRWDNKNIYYYINAQGQLVARTNQAYTNYPQV